ATGQNYTGGGMLTEVEQLVNASTWISFEVALGDALAMTDSAPGKDSLDEALSGMRAHETPMVGAGVHGKLEATGMQWQASYRWQNPKMLTPVDAFANGTSSPYLSFLVRQPLRYRR